MKYYILNVFSDVGIRGGNQLAVIPDASKLTEVEMQNITKQFNFSESTFVVAKNDKEAEVRIFTPGKEINYAGHPTVGTLDLLERLHRSNQGVPRESYNLKLKGGTVKGSYLTNPNDPNERITSFEQMPAKFQFNFENRQLILDSLRISEEDLYDDLPFQVNAVTSMNFLFVRVKDAKVLANLKPDFTILVQEEFSSRDINIYIFTTDPQDGGDLRARFFVPLYGISEDPATGGVQSSLGLCLFNLGLLKDDKVNEIIVEQGYEMGRPSKIYNKYHILDGKFIKTETGGRCFYFAEGEILAK